MSDFSLVPVDYQPDFGDISFVPVDHDPFAPNPAEDKDLILFGKLGLNPQVFATELGDNQQQQALVEQLVHADTAQFYNAAV